MLWMQCVARRALCYLPSQTDISLSSEETQKHVWQSELLVTLYLLENTWAHEGRRAAGSSHSTCRTSKQQSATAVNLGMAWRQPKRSRQASQSEAEKKAERKRRDNLRKKSLPNAVERDHMRWALSRRLMETSAELKKTQAGILMS